MQKKSALMVEKNIFEWLRGVIEVKNIYYKKMSKSSFEVLKKF